MQFIDDVLLAYSQDFAQEREAAHWEKPNTRNERVPGECQNGQTREAPVQAKTVVEKPNLRELGRRGRFGLTACRFAAIAPRQMVGLLGARQFMMRKPQPLVDGAYSLQKGANSPPNGYPSTITNRFSVAQTQQLLEHTKRLSVTLNDLVVRDLLMSIDDFKERTETSGDDWLRLTVPVSLRQHVPADIPAANVLSFVFLERRRRDMSHPDRMLTSLNREMNRIKRNQLGLTFVLSLAAIRSITGSLAGLLPSDEECLATAVLTNPGILFKNSPLAGTSGHLVAGDIRLADVEFIAPFRPNTCAAFSVYTYAGELRITTHFDSRALTESDARKLHSNLVQRLSKSAGD